MVVWYYHVDGRDGGRHLDFARTKEADLDPPEFPGIAEARKRTRGLPFCLIGGAGGGKGGWEGTSNSLIVILKKMAEVFLVCTAFRSNFLADKPISQENWTST